MEGNGDVRDLSLILAGFPTEKDVPAVKVSPDCSTLDIIFLLPDKMCMGQEKSIRLSTFLEGNCDVRDFSIILSRFSSKKKRGRSCS